jgi:soluble epoxide hydrolase / lipid-phosphate phosphatase
MVDSLALNDPRVEHKFAEVGGFRYHYMLAKPDGKPTATIFLIHGWYGGILSDNYAEAH